MKKAENNYCAFDPYTGYVLGFSTKRDMRSFTSHGFWYFSRNEKRFDAKFRKAHARGAYRQFLEGMPK